MRFRTRLFLASAAVSAASLSLAAMLISRSIERRMVESIERTLTAEARLAAQLVRALPESFDPVRLDDEADAMSASTDARVTFIRLDGRVLGDSELDGAALAAIDNHGDRPEVVAARVRGLGVSRRFSTTVGAQLLYVGVRVTGGPVAVVRLARPLHDVEAQLLSVRRLTMVGLGAALSIAVVLSWLFSLVVSRRVTEIGRLAARYALGDAPGPTGRHDRDEIGAVARVLEDSVRELGRRLAEQSRDRARTDAILSGMTEGVLVVNENGHAQLVNEAARRLLRLQEPVLGRHYVELVRDPDIGGGLADALAGRGSSQLELVLPPDRRVVLARAASVTSEAGHGAVLVLHDLTELRRADQIRRDFVANVSHELRTPLTAIRGYAEALADAAPDAAERRRFAEIILRHARRMERLVQDLLRLARLDARQEPLVRESCRMMTLLHDVVTELAPLVEARRQRVEVSVAPAAATVVADPAKLHDVVRNLIENASSYSPEGSRIAIGAGCRHHTVELTVSDEGPGIPDEDLERIFERFYRVDKARSREAGGTGLGLAIVKHLVALHGGNVAAANQPGGGARFTVSLPQPAPEAPTS